MRLQHQAWCCQQGNAWASWASCNRWHQPWGLTLTSSCLQAWAVVEVCTCLIWHLTRSAIPAIWRTFAKNSLNMSRRRRKREFIDADVHIGWEGICRTSRCWSWADRGSRRVVHHCIQQSGERAAGCWSWSGSQQIKVGCDSAAQRPSSSAWSDRHGWVQMVQFTQHQWRHKALLECCNPFPELYDLNVGGQQNHNIQS